jgi:hypothetical protein
MAHDRMNDDVDRNMGRAGQEDDFGSGQDFGKQTPGRYPQDQQTGQKGAGQKNNPLEGDDEYGVGGDQSGESGQSGQFGRTGGGQNR